MQVNLVKKESGYAFAEVSIPVEEVKKYYNEAFNNVVKKARIDGFRKGHAPKSIILSMYGNNINADAWERAIGQNIFKAVTGCNLQAVESVQPTITDAGKFDPESELKFTCKFAYYPELSLDNLGSVHVDHVKINVSDSDIDDMINNFRENMAQFKVVDDAVATDGSRVVIDFVGSRDGVNFDGGTGKDFPVVIGKTAMIPGFVESLKGHKAGDQFQIDCTFPEDYHVEELKGAQAKFDITIQSVAEKSLPDVDENFIASFGRKGDTIEQFRDALRSQLTRTSEDLARRINQNRTLVALRNHFGLENLVPVQEYLEERVAEMALNQVPYLRGNSDTESRNRLIKTLMPMLVSHSASNVVNSFLAQSLALLFKDLEVKTEAVDALIEHDASSYEDPEEFKREVRKDRKAMNSIFNRCYNDMLFNELNSKMEIATSECNFSDASKLNSEFDEGEVAASEDIVARFYPQYNEQKKELDKAGE